MGFVSAQCTCSRATPEHAGPPFPPTQTSAAAQHVSALPLGRWRTQVGVIWKVGLSLPGMRL